MKSYDDITAIVWMLTELFLKPLFLQISWNSILIVIFPALPVITYVVSLSLWIILLTFITRIGEIVKK